MRLGWLLLAALAACAQGFVVPSGPAGVTAVRSIAAAATPVAMTSANKKAKAATKKIKSNRSAAKRFKVTSTGKLLRHFAGKSHLLRKKRPQALAKLRRTGQCDETQLDTYQRLLLVVPKKK